MAARPSHFVNVGAGRGQPRPSPVEEIPDREPDDVLSLRVVIERIRPEIDGGRFAIKRTVGERVDVIADIFADGHDVVVAVLRDRPWPTAENAKAAEKTDGHIFSASSAGSAVNRDREEWRETRMTLVAPGTDEWRASFDTTAVGRHEYHVVAWTDRFLSWRRDVQVKVAAGQDVSLELLEGSLVVRDAAARALASRPARPGDAERLLEYAGGLSDATSPAECLEKALKEPLAALMFTYADRGTFREAGELLGRIADLGFDIVYLPPIHPIGTSFRKGRNNALEADALDPGSPWAIGSPAGGHTAVEPGLGTLDDFAAFLQKAEHLGLEVALDLAWQCSPDHPWVREHPGWFRHRPDGTIRFAENPPKKYQDIYPFDFESEDWRALWRALLAVTQFWIDRGVRMFRVDNPHTKTFGFWEWLIESVHARHSDVIFLAEAFTRPKVMRYLAKAGFTQSYTYFTWRNTKAEITDYFTELTEGESREFLRPNLFVNTPDILHAYLQNGGFRAL